MNSPSEIKKMMQVSLIAGFIIGLSFLIWDITVNFPWWVSVFLGAICCVIGLVIFDYEKDKIPRIITQIRNEISEPQFSQVPETTKHENTLVLAICPRCKTRVPSTSKYCMECGENLQPDKT